jgi:hypothetical protein
VGLLDPNRRLNQLAVVFQPTPAQLADRDAMLAAQLDPRSPSYRRWLTPEQYAARFGADASTIERTRTWLADQSLEVHATSRLGTRVSFGGRVADLQSAFHAEFHRYSIGGVDHYAMASAPVLPPELSGRILGIHNAHDFLRPRPAIRRWPRPEAVCPAGNQTCLPRSFGLSPRDWSQIYDVNPVYQGSVVGRPIDGSGVDIAVVGLAAISTKDVDAFRAGYGLPPTKLTTIVVPGTGAPMAGVASNGTGFEAMADVEWAGGIAPGAHIDYVSPGQDDTNLFDAVFYAIEQDVAPILSESFSACEVGLSPADSDVLGLFGAAANLMGITYLAATGDTGAAGCEVPGVEVPGLYVGEPASLPGVTAVGGTEFPGDSVLLDCSGTATGYPATERGWNETSPVGPASGGGGTSIVFARPSYQANVPTCAPAGTRPRGTSPGAMRQVPDVAFNAGVQTNPYFMQCTLTKDSKGNELCDPRGGNPTVIPVGGTSLGTPSFAGVIALANQAMGTRLGNVNPELYALSTQAPSAFHDITAGSNFVACDPTTAADAGCPSNACPDMATGAFCYGYPAVTGYDCSTGLGSIDVANLVRAWAALPPTTVALAASPTTIAAGSQVSLSATVATTASTPLAGTVTFLAQSPGTIFFEDQGFYDPIFVTADGHVSSSFQSRSLGSVVLGSAPTASLQATLPAGMVRPGAQTLDVIASYDGDGQHAASTSAPLRLTFTGVDLCIFGATRAVAPFDAAPFAAFSSHGPVSWGTAADTTCDEALDCSSIDANGAFVAGPEPGYVVVAARDAVGAVALAFVTVGTPSLPPPWGTQAGTECPASDAGAGDDAGSGDDAASVGDAQLGDDASDASSDAAPPPSGSPDAGSGPVEAGFTGYAPLPCSTFDAASPPGLEMPLYNTGNGCGCASVGSADASGLSSLALLLAGTATLARRRRR